MVKSSHSLYMDINRESGVHSLALCDKRHVQIEFQNGGLCEQLVAWLPNPTMGCECLSNGKFNVSQDTSSRHRLLSSVNLSSQYFSYCLLIPTDLFGV